MRLPKEFQFSTDEVYVRKVGDDVILSPRPRDWRWYLLLLERLQSVPVGDVCMSVITKAELLYGIEVSPRRAQDVAALAAFLPYVDVVDFEEEAAVHCAEIRADLKLRGALIGANDLLIAAHARARGLTLVTNNTAEFERVRGLTIDHWAIPRRNSRRRQ